MRKWPRLNPGGCTHLRAVKKNKKASKVKEESEGYGVQETSGEHFNKIKH